MLPKIMVDSIHSINKNDNDGGNDYGLDTVLASSALKIGTRVHPFFPFPKQFNWINNSMTWFH